MGSEPRIVVRSPTPGQGRAGETAVDLLLDGRQISTCEIIPLTIRVGVATVRMDGIGGVGTTEEHRRRGHSRRVLSAAVAHMAAGDAALTTLYGIPDFYPRFGYTTAGPQYLITMPPRVPAPPLPPGWSSRPVVPADVAPCQALYQNEITHAVAAVLRQPDGYPWTGLHRLARGDGPGACRVLLDPRGELAGYAWDNTGFWFVRTLMDEYRHSFVLAEAVARDNAAADALLSLCHQWAADEAVRRGQPVHSLILAPPPHVPLAAAARQCTASLEQHYSADGEFMARTLHVGRLLRQLAPELALRLRAALPTAHETLCLETDLGGATLHISPDGLSVDDGLTVPPPGVAPPLTVRLPQTALVRLALGAFPPGDLLSRLAEPPTGSARDLLEALFPPCYPHIYLPDRF